MSNNNELYHEQALLKYIKRHPLYRANLTAYHFNNHLQKITDDSVRAIVEEINLRSFENKKL
jgi:hypothetical protein